jgi:hypothetical protein
LADLARHRIVYERTGPEGTIVERSEPVFVNDAPFRPGNVIGVWVHPRRPHESFWEGDVSID